MSMSENRKPYKKPAIVYREKIEARANSCTGSGAKADSSCSSGPILS